MSKKAYNHNQTTASSVWNINHNLDSSFINIGVIIDYNGKQTVSPFNVTIQDNNNVVITFTTPKTGHCRIIQV